MIAGGGRRRFLRRTAGVLLAGLAGCGGGGSEGGSATVTDDTTATPTGSTRTASPTAAADRPGVGVDTVADGFAAPTDVAMPAGVDRTFVADQPGQVYAANRPDTPFLDLSDRVVDLRSGPDERGLLGLAPHPDFASNGRLFVRYSAPRRSSSPPGYSHTFVLSEVTVDPAAAQASSDSERIVLEIAQPQPNHNAGSLAFGPDGYLFVGVGDGGGGGDVGRGHVEDWYERIRGGNGQDLTENLLGSILRIDVDGGEPYAIPDDNPLVGEDGLDEQWAWGFRNPWRFAVEDDALLVADVGQARYEEVSRVERGENYGWNVHEGTHCFDPSAPREEPAGCPSHTLAGAQLRDPVIEYPHPGVESDATATGIAVVGGYRYDGPIEEFDGRYVFADWQADGRLFLADPTQEGLWPISTIPVRGESFGSFVRAFGRDPDGHLYVLTSDRGGPVGSTGALHRLVA
ncbi:PQQ-dependent sugar dehydrogenase [Haloplanus aerogenes]|uniref:Glucose/arabinose dehydrogenase n=1 Tax=Haloplanus aerogenes TaxID=660522 RepID=A0A3M0DRT5_9EURY|nr:PQQ-dependent sugar dehydrogenase [Haloplanus aerogenes]AZH24220.1 sugar dehydrogenase [Haloplanus aerogenes]RMB24154.1 glucose/arabinose dehydrogenase [Haloplanus aerogenes]